MSKAIFTIRPATGIARLTPQVITPILDYAAPDDEFETEDLGAPSSVRRRGLWALMDQGVVSLGNCATTVLLARGLVPEQFGIFMILLEIMIFLNTLQAALVIYPLSVRGAILDNRALKRLAGACMMLTLLIVLPLAGAIITASAFVSNIGIGLLAIGALLMWQCQETLRRAMMAHGGQKRALPGDAISYLGQALCIFLMTRNGTIGVAGAFTVMMFSSAAAVIVQSIQIGPRFVRLGEIGELARDFWGLGRWVMFGNLTLIVTTLGCSWTLAGFHGTEAVAKFQALANLMKLSNPLTICMAGLIVPAAARAFRTRGLDAARSVAFRYGLLTCATIAPYFLFLVIMPTTSIHLIYGIDSAYSDLGNPLRSFVAWYAALLIGQIAGCFLNAIEKSQFSFYAQIAQTGATLLITLPLTALYGLNGLMLGGVIANLTMAAVLIALAQRASETIANAHERFVRHEMEASARVA